MVLVASPDATLPVAMEDSIGARMQRLLKIDPLKLVVWIRRRQTTIISKYY
jgi:hypothetical protein